MIQEVHEDRRDTAKRRESNLRDTVHRHTYDKLRHRQRLARSALGGFRSYGHLLRWAENAANKDLEHLVHTEGREHGQELVT